MKNLCETASEHGPEERGFLPILKKHRDGKFSKRQLTIPAS